MGRREHCIYRMRHWIACILILCFSLFVTEDQIYSEEKQSGAGMVPAMQGNLIQSDSYHLAMEKELGLKQAALESQEFVENRAIKKEIRSGVMLLALAATGSACIGLTILLVVRSRKHPS